MSNRIFVGGLPWEADQNDLQTTFSHFGPVKDAKVIMDKDTGKSRGFGFVTFDSEEDAASAVDTGSIEMDVGGRNRTVRIQEANERPPRSGGGGGSPRAGGSGGGGRDYSSERDDRFEDKSGGRGRGSRKGSRKGGRGDGGGYDDGGGYHSF